MSITKQEIEDYLVEIKEAIHKNRYRIERNAQRQNNLDLFLNYVVSEKKIKAILLGLKTTDFSERVHNKHKGFEIMLPQSH